MKSRQYKIIVCRGPECGERRGSQCIYEAFGRAIGDRGLGDRVSLGSQSCFGRCTQGPNALVREIVTAAPAPRRQFVLATAPVKRRSHSALYNHLTEVDAEVVVDEHILAGGLARRLIQRPQATTPSSAPPDSPDSPNSPNSPDFEDEPFTPLAARPVGRGRSGSSGGEY